jgi:anti-sigma-K factor RskA
MNDDELRELLALAAVGALDSQERAMLDDELQSRPDLRTELEELQSTAASMADAVITAPPPGLRARVLDTIATMPQDEAVAPVVPITAARSRRWWAWGAAAAAVVVLAVGAVVVISSDDADDDEIADVIEADDAVTIAMPGELPGVSIVHSASEDAAVLIADNVPVPEGDRVYELWAIRRGTPEPSGTFRPDDDGTLSVYVAGLDPASAEQWAITEEPAGGSAQPTPPILNATA